MPNEWRDPVDPQVQAAYEQRLDTYRKAQKAHRMLAKAERKAARQERRKK